jgi:ketosteroid isomerase-like protein
MRSWFVRLGLLLALIALGAWGWRTLFPNPERAIRARLSELAQLASFGPNEAPAAKMWNAQKLASFFTPDVTIKVDMNGQQPTFSGRDEIATRAMMARQVFGALTVQFSDIVLTLAPDKQSAIAELSARAKAGGDADTFGPQELTLRMKKDAGKWLISRVETVKTLR